MFESQMKDDRARRTTGRRAFLTASGGAIAGLAIWRYGGILTSPASGRPSGPPRQVTIVQFTDAGERIATVSMLEIQKTDEEWQKQLPPDSFEVARHADTERPFTGALLNVHEKGVFRCICCDTALFSSEAKFDSGTGWPSFWEPIAKENVVEILDRTFGIERTAVSCRLCDAHLGHVFDDGPKPTGLRYCMNSVALKFAAA